MRNPSRRDSSRRASRQREYYEEEEQEYVPPRNRTGTSAIIGFVGGLIVLLVPLGIIHFNASSLNQIARAAPNGGTGFSYDTASSLALWQCSGALVEVAMAIIIGVIARNIVDSRRRGALAGLVAGAVVGAGLFGAQFLPDYPGLIRSVTGGPWWDYPLGFLSSALPYALAGGIASGLGAQIKMRIPFYHRLRR